MSQIPPMPQNYNVFPCAEIERDEESVLGVSPSIPGCVQSQKLSSSKFSDGIHPGFNCNVLL